MRYQRIIFKSLADPRLIDCEADQVIATTDILDADARSIADLLASIEQLDDFGDGFDLRLHALSMQLSDGSLTGFLGASVRFRPETATIRIRMPMSSKFRGVLADGTPVGQIEIGYLNNAVVMGDGAVHLSNSDRFSSAAIVKNVEFVQAPLGDHFTGIDHAIVTWALRYMRVDEFCDREIVPGATRLDYGRVRGLLLADPKRTVRFIVQQLQNARTDETYTDLMREEWDAWIGNKTVEATVRQTLLMAGFRNLPSSRRHILA